MDRDRKGQGRGDRNESRVFFRDRERATDNGYWTRQVRLRRINLLGVEFGIRGSEFGVRGSEFGRMLRVLPTNPQT